MGAGWAQDGRWMASDPPGSADEDAPAASSGFLTGDS